MSCCKTPTASSLLVALSVASAIGGWLVPAFYDWTGSDQSRPSPLMWQVPLGMVVAAMLLCLILPWIRIRGWSENVAKQPTQFNLRSVMLLTAVIAFAIGLRYPRGVSIAAHLTVLATTLRWAVAHPTYRLAVAALLGCMFLPFIWLLGDREIDAFLPVLFSIAVGAPGILPMALTSSLFGMNPNEATWLAILFTAAEIAIGTCFIRGGAKRTIAYIVFVVLGSLMGSLILNALVRA
ncbi:hypothetical protein FYK55_24325 [Roseiconus nitratireducens]|uniref:Uncharacterized protein n=1 Tax=Roseiconus nitratireducens TaxID=2605748 RepID=A0A5M6CWJ4_9BACT|nr:hypothetical protein [Roseiconus nitratireducens]KAA5539463.1 hypothetical protein FYK55_24325 [Roseiconus nitratireducens]